MKRLTLGALACALILSASACGEETTIEAIEACPTADHDMHVAQAHASPDDVPMMLHVRNRTCVGTGQNTFQLLFWKEGGHDSAPPALETQSEHDEHTASGDAGTDDGHDVEVKSVAFTMPSMGHGTSEAPMLDKTYKDHFMVHFQMPGKWSGEVEFIDHTVTHTTQTVEFTLDVK